MNQPSPEYVPDFSLVQGGPLFQIFIRTHLSGDAFELLPRRMILITALAWVPLLILSAFSGHLLGDAVVTPFLLDIEAHVRFLVAVPVLIAAELVVHRRIVPIVRNFVRRGLVLPEEIPRYRRIVESTMKLRNSVWVEVVLLALVYTLGFWVWASRIALTTSSWYAIPEGDGMRLTPAGYWSVFVAVPIFQFILIRWYFRFFVWFSFLWRVSRLRLQVIPSHPDRTAGLGFLGRSTTAFTPIIFAQGAMLSGLIASQIAFAGRSLPSFKVQVLSFLIFFVVIVLSPLTVFAPTLWRAKLQGAAEFGQLAVRYNRRFEQKWVHGEAPPDDELLGSADIQSLADLGNSHSVVQEIRLFPFGWRDVTRLISVAASPLLPLLLTIFSLEQVADYMIKILFLTRGAIMRTCNKLLITVTIGGLLGSTAIATTPIVYPAKNQTPQQQQKDEGECSTWAKQTTGIDPAVVAAAPATAPPATTTAAEPEKSSGPKGQRVKGAAKGAAAGAVVGEVANNDADQGAATGAAVGAIAGGSRARRDRRDEEEQAKTQATEQQQAAEQQAQAAKDEQLATYGRARAACLEGRGYVLK